MLETSRVGTIGTISAGGLMNPMAVLSTVATSSGICTSDLSSPVGVGLDLGLPLSLVGGFLSDNSGGFLDRRCCHRH